MGPEKKKNQRINYLYMHDVFYELCIAQLRRIQNSSVPLQVDMWCVHWVAYCAAWRWFESVLSLPYACWARTNCYENIGNTHLLIEKIALPHWKNTHN